MRLVVLFGFLVATSAAAIAQEHPSAFSVAGLALGGRVNFDSREYRQYNCAPSDQFDGFTWCHAKKDERERRGLFNAYYAILHSRDGTAVYINRFQEPAFWEDDEIEKDIKLYSRKIGGEPRILKMQSQRGLPGGIIAVWGKIALEPLDNESRKLVAAGSSVSSVNRGVLIDFLGNYERSAREDLPLYRITGGPGFAWAGSNKNGRGLLRFLAINPAEFYPSSHAASFACGRYLEQRVCPEMLICSEQTLGRLDSRMASLYEAARAKMPKKFLGRFKDYQGEWLARRGKCGCDYQCLESEYHSQIDALGKTISGMGQ
jgi:hypothetical protein